MKAEKKTIMTNNLDNHPFFNRLTEFTKGVVDQLLPEVIEALKNYQEAKQAQQSRLYKKLDMLLGSLNYDIVYFEFIDQQLNLPDEIEVYRGQDIEYELGWSWTTNKAVAKKFAKRNACFDAPQPIILTGLVKKANIVAFFDQREEDEILVAPDGMRVLETYQVEC